MSDFQATTGFANDETAAIVLYSGGLDSTLALMRARAIHKHIAALMIDYGQPHRDAELCAAGRILHELAVPASRICIADALAMARPADRMANAPHTSGVPHPAEVPGRNAQFLTNALTHGRVWWPDKRLEIWMGATLDDCDGFIDCNPDFFLKASAFLTAGSRVPVLVVTPFFQQSKRHLIASASEEELRILRLSWSCYRGGAKPCGECTPCVLRADAFAHAGLDDGPGDWKLTGGDPHREMRLQR